MNKRMVLCLPLLAAMSFAATPDTTYRTQIEAWRQQHEVALKSDSGWLTVTGLYWLHEGANALGSAPQNDIVLPATAPAHVGVVRVTGGAATFTASEGADVKLRGAVVKSLEWKTDGAPQALTSGPLTFLLLKRGARLAVRLKDQNAVARQRFTHLDWYPVNEEWRVTARFVSFPQPRQLVLDTIIGEQETVQSPGYVEFERNGEHYRLQAVSSGKSLFFVFRDATSGRTTYAASRFLRAPLPDANGNVTLDFNRAENPPCAFTNYATCPLPPPDNRLSLAVEAGERKYEVSAR